MKNIEILYENDNFIIVSKPAGLAVQGGEGVKTSLDKLLAEYNASSLLVHRIDKDTSGILLAAKGRENAARFSKIFGQEKKAVKTYVAVCAANPERLKSEGIIKDELVIRGVSKKSETKYKVIKSGALEAGGIEYSVLELELGTGRMHQIRRHLAMNGSPILGDDKYGDFSLNKKLNKTIKLKRLLLHAYRLVIKDGYNIDINAPLPEYFNSFFPSPANS